MSDKLQFVLVNVRLLRVIRFGEARRLELIGEGFNLTNRLNPTNIVRGGAERRAECKLQASDTSRNSATVSIGSALQFLR